MTACPVQTAVHTILSAYDDPTRPDLVDTPRRVADAYRELLTPQPFTMTTFAAGKHRDIVVELGVPFFTLCEHHLLPFFGKVSLAYLPGDRLVGISKLARTVEHYARRLNTQERFTAAIADHLAEALNPRGVAVVATARHLCQHMRGVRTEGLMRTQAFTGEFQADTMHRREFFSAAQHHH